MDAPEIRVGEAILELSRFWDATVLTQQQARRTGFKGK